ncbi:DNA translocase FtsK [Virgibacillus sp. M23]|uniref:DNA translocase FtsK n=1 Tax=Virgibacillus sp. M23 TaxID=3079030 RepID=UPI002A909A25|nr:DNA translocase FtsK [Virgibacillus sp. M23]MDY7046242.1 DNA translocase FtsK [Virgibacillus sp. M23]
MWDNWKKKIKSLFADSEEEEKQHEESRTAEKSNLEAKMMYQYPANKSFRFPVIPDRVEERTSRKQVRETGTLYNTGRITGTKTEENRNSQRKATKASRFNQSVNEQQPKEVPAYQRKRQSRTSQHVSVERREKSEKQNNHNANKVYKKDPDIPFRPTEVPSPIYGFRPRHEEKKVENIPAYQRKEENNSREEQKLFDESESIVAEAPLKEKELPDAEGEQRNLLREQDEVDESNFIVQDDSIQQENQDHSYDKEELDSRPEPEKQIKRSEKRKQNRDSVKTAPFNVMMTPRDKKNLFEKSKQKQKQEEKIIKTTAPEKNNKEHRIPYYLLNDIEKAGADDRRWMEGQQKLLEQTLTHFNVRARVVNATQGPSVTRFEVQPELGVKVSKVKNLSDDLKLNMAAKDIRIEAPIPGKNTIGIEIPNPKAQMVGLQAIFETEAFSRSLSPLTIALGLSIEGQPLITNIQKMPHGLIAGATGSGKSVCINTMIISLLYKASHEDVKFLLIDPKMVELAPYNGIPHLVSPVITDVKAATAALKWAVAEMEDRYEKFVHEGVRDIERYNQKMIKQDRKQDKMPFIVIVIDELADLMMVSPQDVEDAISRIAQKARACGIHLLLATQRPSVDVITGLIKANIPTRIAFSVSSQVDSRTILDTSGAEKLLGKGDMLFIENGAGKSIRLQGPFVSDEEIERVTNHVRGIAEPNYLFEQEQLLEQVTMDEEEDDLLQDVILFVLEQNGASTSMLQRHFKIGYNRAARLIDTLEHRGIISGQNGSKPREVLVTLSQVEDML